MLPETKVAASTDRLNYALLANMDRFWDCSLNFQDDIHMHTHRYIIKINNFYVYLFIFISNIYYVFIRLN